MQDPEKPLFSFGVISDVQYADCDNGRSFHGDVRYYRHALQALRKAVQTWNEINDKEEENTISFVVNLGDIIDGQAKENTVDQLDRVLQEFAEFKGGPVYHLVGNHCLYNLSRAQLHPKLGLDHEETAYFDFSPHEQFRFVMDLNSPEGLRGRLRRYVAFNGALGEEQMKWLEGVLEDASAKEQRVIICTHVPFYPHNSTANAIVWNYEEVMSIIEKYDCVKVVLAGHDHSGGYRHHHVHHYIFKGVVECEPGSNAFSRMDVFEDRIVMQGFGGLESKEFPFRQGHERRRSSRKPTKKNKNDKAAS